MGRPIKKRYFSGGADPIVYAGESVYSVSYVTSGTGYTNSATTTVVFSNPDLANGSVATGFITTNTNGNVTGLVVTNGGSGYTGDPGIALVGANGTGAVSYTHLTLPTIYAV